MAKFEPIINCGYFSGQNPMCWNGEQFDTEEECNEWIAENMNRFALDELGGGIYPQEVYVTEVSFDFQ